jgi:prepilin signal peptidase PulO-like enzyme (type II secretory pathway)
MVAGLSCLTAILAAYLSWQDWRTQSIPMLGLLGWLAMSALFAFYGNPSLMVFCVLSGISLSIGLYQHFSKKVYIGIADLVVLTSLSAWVHVEKLPILFLICGVLGIASAIILKNKRFPFLPALFLAAAIVSFF